VVELNKGPFVGAPPPLERLGTPQCVVKE